jgi:hypothetical protein
LPQKGNTKSIFDLVFAHLFIIWGLGKPKQAHRIGLATRLPLQFGLAISAFFMLFRVLKSPKKAQKSTHGHALISVYILSP